MDEKTLKALGDPKRYLLLQLVAEKSWCVGALARRSGLSESAVSQHLKILREAGLVYGVKRGYYTHYRLDKEALDCVISELQQLREMRFEPCEGRLHGCPESEYIRCKVYAPQENRKKEEEN